MSKRLIDANELISAMYYYEHNEGGLTAYDAQDIINKAPTIEPKRGEWEYCEDYTGQDGYECSECGFFAPWHYSVNDICFISNYHFCPQCGARMKGKDNE